MKKIISILLVLFALVSCYKVETFKSELIPANFSDECIVHDTVTFNMSCTVFDDHAKFTFIKKVSIPIEEKKYEFGDYVYTFQRDTVTTLIEEVEYSSLGFKQKLIEDNKKPRNDFWFLFTSNMGLTWYTFDKIYNTYIK